MPAAAVCKGFTSFATGAAVTSLKSSVPIDTNAVGGNSYSVNAALIRAVGQNCNITLDGATLPTTAAGGGYNLNTTDTQGTWIYGLSNLLNLKAIAVTGTGSISILWFDSR